MAVTGDRAEDGAAADDSVGPWSSGPWSPEQIEVEAGGLLRACAFPLALLDGWDDPDLSGAARGLLAERDAVTAEAEHLTDLLASAVPHATKPERAVLLRLRRTCHRDRRPLPDLTTADAAVLAPSGLDDAWSAAARAREDLAAAEGRFAERYRVAGADDRARLAAISAEDAFRRALAVANRGLARRWAGRPGPDQRWRARDERAERAVLRYLLRAVSRPVPQGLWAGVAPLHVDERLDGSGIGSSPAPGAVVVEPDPAPLARIVDAWARSGAVLDRPVALDASVHRHPHGWRFEHGDTAMTWSILQPDDLVDAVVEHLWSGPAGLRALTGGEAIAAPDVLERLVADLLAVGFLVPAWSGADGGDVWAVLAAAEEVLVAGEVDRWRRLLGALREGCAVLERDLLGMDPEVVARWLDDLAGLVAATWREAGVGGDPPTDVVQVTLRLPLDATWSARTATDVQRAVREHLAFARADGSVEALRRASVAGLGSGPLSEVLAAARAPGGAVQVADEAIGEARAALTARWAERLGRPHGGEGIRVGAPDDPSAEVGNTERGGPGPEGSVLVRVGGEGGPLLSLARPQADVYTGRFSAVVAPSGVSTGGAAEPGPAGGVTSPGDAAPGGLPPLTLVLDRSANPAVRVPAGRGPVIRTRRGAPPWATLTARWRDGRPVVVHAGREHRLRHPTSGGSWTGRERTLVRLALAHGWEHLSHGVPVVPDEVGSVHPTPPVSLPGGARLSARRWVLGPGDLGPLVAAATTAPEEGYLAWHRLLLARGIEAARVSVRFGARADAPALIVPVSSPLAVAAMVERLARVDHAVVEEAEPPTVVAASGLAVGEVAIRWSAARPASGGRAVSAMSVRGVDEPASSSSPPGAGVRPTDRPVAPLAGVGWHHYDLAIQPPAPGARPQAPLAALADLVDRLLVDGRVRDAFFVRKPPGLRFRVATAQPDDPQVDGAVVAWVEDQVREGGLTGWSRGVYRPEVRRFGGPTGMALAHRVFTADTVVALHLERALDREGTADDGLAVRRAVSAAVTAALLEAVLDPGEQLVLWELAEGLLPASAGLRRGESVGAGPPGAGPAALSLPERPSAAESPVETGPVVAVVAEVGPALLAARAAGTLEVGVVPWCVGALAFHWNRLGLPLYPDLLRTEVERATAAARARARHGGGAITP